MATLDDITHELFLRSVLANDPNDGYPDGVEFIPADAEWADQAAWQTLKDEGQPVVLIERDIETLFVPQRRSIFDRLIGRVRIVVQTRPHGQPATYAMRQTLRREPLQQMRALAAK